MKKLSSILGISVLTFLIISCHKDDDSQTAKFHTPCESVLDGWNINSYKLPEVQRQSDVCFPSLETGYTVGIGGTILKTTDGGENWAFLERYYDITSNHIVTDALTKARLCTVFFLNNEVGFVGGEGEKDLIDQVFTQAVYLKTVDGGQTWSKQYLEGIEVVHDIYFFDADNGLGLFSLYDNNHYYKTKLLATHDGGGTWEPVLPTNLDIRSSSLNITANSIYVWAEENYLTPKYLRSTDHGTNWVEVPLPANDCNWVNFETDELGFTNCSGKIYKTTDGGNTWAEMDESPLNESILMHFKSANEGFVFKPVYDYVSGGGETSAILNSFEVYQTSDGGITWKESVIDKECDFTGTVFTFSNNVLYTVGWSAVNKFEFK